MKKNIPFSGLPVILLHLLLYFMYLPISAEKKKCLKVNYSRQKVGKLKERKKIQESFPSFNIKMVKLGVFFSFPLLL